jgi:glycosyltransferase involved in cell wall biosynthesis
MKILVLTQYFYPHTGGSQEYILELYKKFIKQDPTTSVDIICYNTDRAVRVEVIDGITIHRVSCLEILPGQFAVTNPFELFTVIQKLKQKNGKYDIVNSHTRFFDNSWWAPLVAHYFSAKSVLTDHCASHPVHQNALINGCVQLFDAVLARVIPRMYDSVISVSQATSDFLNKFGNTHEIPVFYSGVNQAFLENSQAKLPVKGLTGKTIVSFVGRMIETKNPALAVEVATNITQNNKNVVFLFAGDGAELQRLQKFASPQIHFLGKLNREQTATLLQKTDILLHPSVHHEGLPITLLEAGYSKVAVIASSAGATAEVISNHRSGLIVNPTIVEITAATESLLTDSTLRNKLANNLYEYVSKHFNWSQTAKKYRSFLHSVISE